MRRIALSGLALALTLGTASLVAAQQAPQGQARQGQGQWQGRGERGQGGRGQKALFKGVKLTDQQKAQIGQIRQKYGEQSRQLRQSLRPAGEQGQAQPGQGERRVRPAFDRNSPQFQQLRSLREQEMREVRALLTPDQQRTFDGNVAQMKARMEKREQKRAERQGK